MATKKMSIVEKVDSSPDSTHTTSLITSAGVAKAFQDNAFYVEIESLDPEVENVNGQELYEYVGLESTDMSTFNAIKNHCEFDDTKTLQDCIDKIQGT